MSAMRKACMLLLMCVVICALPVAYAAVEWTEADFAFYNSDMSLYKKPVASTDSWDSYINMKDGETGQTFRGIKLGSYAEELLQKYDLSDAEWSIYDTSKEAKYGETDRSKALTEKWKTEGKNGADVLALSDFLCAKGYYFYIKLDVYRVNGKFVTKSQVVPDDLDIDAIMREQLIVEALERYDNSMSREELEATYDKYIVEQPDDFARTRDYYLEQYIRKHERAYFQFRIENGVVERIELTDYYYKNLGAAYNDDGTVNEDYAYILDLK